LLLGAVAPRGDSDFIYCPAGKWNGEAQYLLAALAWRRTESLRNRYWRKFQRGGFFVTHVLECPVEGCASGDLAQLIANRLPAVLTRIRRSLKPKRLAPITMLLKQALPAFNSGDLPCAILLDQGMPFELMRTRPPHQPRTARSTGSQGASARQGSA